MGLITITIEDAENSGIHEGSEVAVTAEFEPKVDLNDLSSATPAQLVGLKMIEHSAEQNLVVSASAE